MPNWCMNEAKLTHEVADIVKVTVAKLEAMQTDRVFRILDPHWEYREATDVDWTVNSDYTEITLNFSSAWSPPTELYETLAGNGWSVWATYYETGMEIAGIGYDGDMREFDDIHSITDEDLESDPDLKEVAEHWGIMDEIEMLREMEDDEEE